MESLFQIGFESLSSFSVLFLVLILFKYEESPLCIFTSLRTFCVFFFFKIRFGPMVHLTHTFCFVKIWRGRGVEKYRRRPPVRGVSSPISFFLCTSDLFYPRGRIFRRRPRVPSSLHFSLGSYCRHGSVVPVDQIFFHLPFETFLKRIF